MPFHMSNTAAPIAGRFSGAKTLRKLRYGENSMSGVFSNVQYVTQKCNQSGKKRY